MSSTSSGYRAAVRLGVTLAPALSLINSKIRSATGARKRAGERLLDWGRRRRDPARPVVWFHASSVGEGLQAQSVLRALRRLHPDCQILYTHFSPSAEGLANQMDADAADYLPYDLPANVDRLLNALEPDLLVFAKADVWPELSTRAANSGVAVALVAGTVSPGSSRLRWPVRALLEPGYRAVAAAAVVAPEDGERLRRLGVEPDRIRVLGDPRYDSVTDRVLTVSRDEPLLRFGRGAPTMVAGSTWLADEAVLLHAFHRLRQHRPDARLILVPHEPTSDHLASLERRVSEAGVPAPVRLSRAESPQPLLLVDRVGVLATLYGAGAMAFVGGGYGTAGLHSVLEPAAWGIPVVFGPRWRNSRDARSLIEAGAAIALPGPRVHTSGLALHQQWDYWIANERIRAAQGNKARAVVEQGRGASERSAGMLAELISKRRPRTSPRAE
jgi:3-deoxy-D-manno-octulosonic-acid transferase